MVVDGARGRSLNAVRARGNLDRPGLRQHRCGGKLSPVRVRRGSRHLGGRAGPAYDRRGCLVSELTPTGGRVGNETCRHSPLVLKGARRLKGRRVLGAVGERAEYRFAVGERSPQKRAHMGKGARGALASSHSLPTARPVRTEPFAPSRPVCRILVLRLLLERTDSVREGGAAFLCGFPVHTPGGKFGSPRWPRLRFSVTAGASAFVLLEQDGAKFGEFVGPVGEEAKDGFAVVGFERDLAALESPGVLQFVGDVEFPGVSEPSGEFEDRLVQHGNAGEEHAYDFDRLRHA